MRERREIGKRSCRVTDIRYLISELLGKRILSVEIGYSNTYKNCVCMTSSASKLAGEMGNEMVTPTSPGASCIDS